MKRVPQYLRRYILVIHCALLPGVALGQAVTTSLLASGGGAMSNAQFTLSSILGQTHAGVVSAGDLSERVGFLYLPVIAQVTTDISDETIGPESVPSEFSLIGVYPNPLGSTGTIKFALPAPEHVRVIVFDVTGRRLMIPVDRPVPAGVHEVVLQTGNLTSGTYLVRLETADHSPSRIVQVVH